ncbi:Bifunctional (p)ppGpp synthetase/guanosine-3',5'-bis(diphosphate) 3'-pyrophosphohydrolase [Rickettsiales endosymbiont of Paramecium tredecaurelia]|uniref:RelA/SpoT family protein n=1 Tax=Candidatus Sarmatiella mevalonica TaxID=2770581 RepID=UPI0019209749|nr:RelA/SpoT family protein [Candidatus Sarmatiella mevalonica]MBL3284378.1 Bifunctional (p)ppGpp synthetase/guanosine-3',5'-bis(diphosphate) 3'-pyrophosphohydrolase [Candidatus Sarmatiella mevalonica]
MRDKLLHAIDAIDCAIDRRLIHKAINFAIYYHQAQNRASGEPYYTHPVEVAIIVMQMYVDEQSIVAAILHDTLEDTSLTHEQIIGHFGQEIAALVDGVTKITKLEYKNNYSLKQTDNLHKLLLATNKDLRVLFIKIADRLHNIRTIHSIPSIEKRKRIALETLEIYSPLAERVGMHRIKHEFQDICFKVLYPTIREFILNNLMMIYHNEDQIINQIKKEIKNKLIKSSISNIQVEGRLKTPYSIWMKMKEKSVNLSQLSDIIAFRILVETTEDCYKALGVLHTNYKAVPNNFQDFISTPKINNYQSLHTLLSGVRNHCVEIQIRSFAMHQVAEFGIASHWQYKQKGFKAKDKYFWMRDLLSIFDVEDSSDSNKKLLNTKLAMYYDQVFCLTPGGSVISLPSNATVLDFAYAVNSSTGNKCVGAKVNNEVSSLDRVLQNGDQVEIIISKNQKPSPSWEKFAITGKAKSEIRKSLLSNERDKWYYKGRSMLSKMLECNHLDITDSDVSALCNFFCKVNSLELMEAIGHEQINLVEIEHFLNPTDENINTHIPRTFLRKNKRQAKNTLPLETSKMIKFAFAMCCRPLPEEKIVGLITTQGIVYIHQSDCKSLDELKRRTVVGLDWENDDYLLPRTYRLLLKTLDVSRVIALHKLLAMRSCRLLYAGKVRGDDGLRTSSIAREYYFYKLSISKGGGRRALF